MSESLYPYYERELVAIRQLAQEFARLYPAAAGRLLLEPGRSGDPHIERLIESFALLTARVQHKLDDEFPELTDALLNVLYPHYLAPVPSMAVLQFVLDATRTPLPNGFPLERGSRVKSQPVNGVPLRYRTGYPVTLWPVGVAEARLIPPPFPPGFAPPPRAAAALCLRLESQGGLKFADLSLETLRFFLSGDVQVTSGLYELLFLHVLQIVMRPGDAPDLEPITLTPAEALAQVGFGRDEGLVPMPSQSFPGYRLLTEFFTFPAKFLFFDLSGFRRAAKAGFQKQLEVVFYLGRSQANLEKAVEASTFRLGCTPVINLFEQVAEPIAVAQTRHEYQIVPDVTNPEGMEVWSVDSVTSTDPTAGVTTEYQPFYSIRHAQHRDETKAFWYASRRLSGREGDRGSDVHLSLVDLNFRPTQPADATLVIRTTCTNRHLPRGLQQLGGQVLFELEAPAPLARILCPRTPSTPLQPPMRRAAHWRLIAHLNLNHLSITDPGEGKAALQEILALYDFSEAEAGQQYSVARSLIEGVRGISSRRVTGRVGDALTGGIARGVEIRLELDEEKYIGSGMLLFASVLERFLALYASVNSFTQLVATATTAERFYKKWPPRAGEIPLL